MFIQTLPCTSTKKDNEGLRLKKKKMLSPPDLDGMELGDRDFPLQICFQLSIVRNGCLLWTDVL